MDLVTRGRLSVQRVGENAWAAIELMAKNGGWEELDMKPGKKGGKTKGSVSKKEEETRDSSSTTKLDQVNLQGTDRNHPERNEEADIINASTKRKRRTAYADTDDDGERLGLRRSNRTKK